MNIAEVLKAISLISLTGFSFYMAQQQKDDATRRQWKNILSLILLVFFVGKLIEEFAQS